MNQKFSAMYRAMTRAMRLSHGMEGVALLVHERQNSRFFCVKTKN